MIYLLNKKKNLISLYKLIKFLLKGENKINYKKNSINNFFLIIIKNKNKLIEKEIYKHSGYPGSLKVYSNKYLYKKNFLSFLKLNLKKYIKLNIFKKIKVKIYNKYKILNIYE